MVLLGSNNSAILILELVCVWDALDSTKDVCVFAAAVRFEVAKPLGVHVPVHALRRVTGTWMVEDQHVVALGRPGMAYVSLFSCPRPIAQQDISIPLVVQSTLLADLHPEVLVAFTVADPD